MFLEREEFLGELSESVGVRIYTISQQTRKL